MTNYLQVTSPLRLAIKTALFGRSVDLVSNAVVGCSLLSASSLATQLHSIIAFGQDQIILLRDTGTSVNKGIASVGRHDKPPLPSVGHRARLAIAQGHYTGSRMGSCS